MQSGNSNGGWTTFFEHWRIEVLVLAIWFISWVFLKLI